MNTDLMKIHQNRDAQKIKDLLIQISGASDLPEIYDAGDFSINEKFIEHSEEYADVKIEIKNRYCISPTIIEQRGTAKKGKGKILPAKGWLVEEIIYGESSSEEPARADHKTIGKFSGVTDIVRMILLVDAAAVIDQQLYFAAEKEEATAIEEEWKKCLT